MRFECLARVLRLRVLIALPLLAWSSGPARAADPMLMFLLGFAKNLVESAIERNAAQRPALVPPAPLAPAVPAVPQKTPAQLDAADLRTLVDDSFAYLDRTQRNELLAGLQKALDDPANAPYREHILAQFVFVARQVSFTHRQLDRLSAEDKQALAERFAANYRLLAPEQQQALSRQLQARALPLPADLNDMMLAALAAR
jgi:hypothetical protein